MPKRSKVELRVDQNFQIIEYYQKHPSLKQTELIKHFNKILEIKDELVMPNVKEAIYMIKEAWDKVSRETIVNCWRHAGNIL